MPGSLKVAVRTAFLAPPLRLRSGLRADRLILHTVQSAGAFRELLSTGEYRGDPSLAEQPFAEAYDWISGQMRDRLGPHGAGEGLVWLWAKSSRSGIVNQLRAEAAGAVLLTVCVAPDRVLLTDFYDWHDVLNRRLHVPLNAGESDDDWWIRAEPLMDEWDDRVGGRRAEPVASWPPTLRADLFASWLPIVFDGPGPSAKYVQATMRTLRIEDVVRAIRVR